MFHFRWTIYSLISLGSGIGALVTAAAVWQNRQDQSARRLAALALVCAFWGILTGLEFASTTLAGSLVWAKLSFLGIAASPGLLLQFALEYVRQAQPPKWGTATLWAVTICTVAAVWSNDYHGLFWYSTIKSPTTLLVDYGRGPIFYLFMSYTYLTCGMALAMLMAGALRDHKFYLGQRLAVLVATAIPIIANVAYVTDRTPIRDLDWTPISMAVSCAVLAFSMRRQRLFDLRPVLRSRLLDVMDEAVLLIDERGRIADYNQAMARLVPAIKESTGRPCSELLPNQPELCAAFERPEEMSSVLELDLGEVCVFDVRSRPLAFSSGRSRGHLAVLHDITAEQRLETERNGLLADLRDALDRVQELGGLLPICAHCKSIRTDDGFWQHVEAFIAEHSEAETSLALCPACHKALADSVAMPLETHGALTASREGTC